MTSQWVSSVEAPPVDEQIIILNSSELKRASYLLGYQSCSVGSGNLEDKLKFLQTLRNSGAN